MSEGHPLHAGNSNFQWHTLKIAISLSVWPSWWHYRSWNQTYENFTQRAVLKPADRKKKYITIITIYQTIFGYGQLVSSTTPPVYDTRQGRPLRLRFTMDQPPLPANTVHFIVLCSWWRAKAFRWLAGKLDWEIEVRSISIDSKAEDVMDRWHEFWRWAKCWWFSD